MQIICYMYKQKWMLMSNMYTDRFMGMAADIMWWADVLVLRLVKSLFSILHRPSVCLVGLRRTKQKNPWGQVAFCETEHKSPACEVKIQISVAQFN
jgi:hypothetical protein